ncbi:unnamed protein product [Effrenium voratum]|uniref:Uncharacterized protein n=1 Tax=Effrenium voratum TaxID=2562239 RepID=A0AA36IVP1_9DINO|nr:unnamed protein product [Effrenium voratum]
MPAPGWKQAGPESWACHKWYLLKLLTSLFGLVFLRWLAASLGEVVAPALCALTTGAALVLWHWADQMIQQQRQLETTKGWKNGMVCLHRSIGGVELELSIEEALGLSSALAQLAPAFFFENWGLHGSFQYRWVAVIAHLASALLVTLRVRKHVLPGNAHMQVEVWLGLAAGNWVASSWAAGTWWGVACTQARLPALALASAQLINFWLVHSSGQPQLLAACVALGGLSMAGCCSGPAGVALDAEEAPALLTPTIYITFCVVSALLLFQELFMSL